MKSVEHIRDFLNRVVTWASAQEDIQAIALVGSCARALASRRMKIIALSRLSKKLSLASSQQGINIFRGNGFNYLV